MKKKDEIVEPKPPLTCRECEKPYSTNALDHCKCGVVMPWLRGKLA